MLNLVGRNGFGCCDSVLVVEIGIGLLRDSEVADCSLLVIDDPVYDYASQACLYVQLSSGLDH